MSPTRPSKITAPAVRARKVRTGSEPLVSLRYFGPNAQPNAPNVGDHKRR